MDPVRLSPPHPYPAAVNPTCCGSSGAGRVFRSRACYDHGTSLTEGAKGPELDHLEDEGRGRVLQLLYVRYARHDRAGVSDQENVGHGLGDPLKPNEPAKKLSTVRTRAGPVGLDSFAS
jgi:hypothetical protein